MNQISWKTQAVACILFITHVLSQCSTSNPCAEGCCSVGGGYCGYGPEFCASSVCNAAASADGTCAQKSQCDPGVYPGYGSTWGSDYAESETCPLNVCCSQYGFCGTTTDFCGTVTWPDPSCSGTSSSARTVGYYEGWNWQFTCNKMSIDQIPVDSYTHLNFAFVYIDPDSFDVVPMDSSQAALYGSFTALKSINPSLQTWISIGGWSFNDPGATETTFSTLAGSASAQASFFSSLLTFLQTYGFDGVDIDWEYPGTPDRSGSPADYANFVTFLQNLKAALTTSTKTYGVSITLPSSYWYMQYFDIVNIANTIDWFNVMTYDIYGTWDATISSIGPYVYADTNLTQIELSMELLWHNNINPSQVNLGLGFYGRSYTLSDPTCTSPGCPFSSGGSAGPCTGTVGMLSYTEIENIISDPSRGATVILDQASAVKIAVFDNDQWVGYDDSETLALKKAYANSRCIGGTLVWAVDLDTTGQLTGTAGENGTDNATPDGVDIIPLPCTTVPPSATFTLTPACASDVASLSANSSNNSPPGPSPCDEDCDLLRLLTATCCGSGGSVGNPIVIPANVPLPAALPLPSGFTPSQPISISASTYPALEPLSEPITIPANYVPTVNITVPGQLSGSEVIPAYNLPLDVPIPDPINLPAGYEPINPIPVPGIDLPAGTSLDNPVVIPAAAIFPSPFVIPPLIPLAGDFPSESSSASSPSTGSVPATGTQTYLYPVITDDPAALSSLASSISAAEVTVTDTLFATPTTTADQCAASNLPVQTDCAQISIPQTTSTVSATSGTCYTQSGSSLEWCDMFTSGTCQVSMGWDTTDGSAPTTTDDFLYQELQAELWRTPCVDFTVGVSSASGGTPWMFCIKRVGQPCLYSATPS